MNYNNTGSGCKVYTWFNGNKVEVDPQEVSGSSNVLKLNSPYGPVTIPSPFNVVITANRPNITLEWLQQNMTDGSNPLQYEIKFVASSG